MKAVLLSFLVIFTIFSCKQLTDQAGLPKDLVEAQVVKVIDGDTISVEINGIQEKVRLIGIDTPESRINKRAQLQEKELGKDTEDVVELGRKAKEFTQSLLKVGSKVYLEFDVQQRDKYGRLLAYVYLPDGRMVNKEIICNGYAMPLTIPPNVKHERDFKECFQKAREGKKGLWNE